jgi:predicted anti-sigma-YlaC factor YlaD
MSNHVTEWLNAYMDGELKNGRLHQVEAHLADCMECQAELESLQGLSSLLHTTPSPEFIPSERFAAQVGLRLPREQPKAVRRSALNVGWWLIPIGLLILWMLLNTSSWVSQAFSAADELGLLTNVPALLTDDAPHEDSWSATLAKFGLLNENNLQWAEATEAFAENTLPRIVWQGSIALLYLSWVALWWAGQKPQETGPLLESSAASTE